MQSPHQAMHHNLTELIETNISSLFSEALTADVQTVLSNQTRTGAADTALS